MDRCQGQARGFRSQWIADPGAGSLRRAQGQSDLSSHAFWRGVAKAKQAIADYKKALGDPAGVAELMVFFCEQAARFCNDVGNDDYIYLGALVRMFGQALNVARTLPDASQAGLVARLDRVRGISHKLGYGVGEEMDLIFAKYTEGVE